MSFKKLNTAEAITLVRVLGFPLILLFTFLDYRNTTAWLFILLFCTDFMDGYFAFFFGQESARRAQLDTLGDILLLLAGVYSFFVFETAFFIKHIIFIYLIFGMYTTQLFIAFLKWEKPTSFHTYSAKLAAIAQVIFLTITLMFEAIPGLFYFAALLSAIDALEDIVLTLLLKRWKANIKGLFWYNADERQPKQDLKGS